MTKQLREPGGWWRLTVAQFVGKGAYVANDEAETTGSTFQFGLHKEHSHQDHL